MATRGMRKSKKQAGEPRDAAAGGRRSDIPGGVFTCGGCGSALQLEHVLSVEAERSGASVTGYILIEHRCGCGGQEILQTRAWGSFPAFIALFGRLPVLPYRSPFAGADVGPDDPTMARWHWELDQIADMDEFLLFLDDARNGRSDAA